MDIETSTKYDYKKRISYLFTILISLFCFLIFPAFILNVTLDNFLTLRDENRVNQIRQSLFDNLNRLESYKTNQDYFNKILSKIVKIADSHPKPQKYLKKALAKLKQNYPNQLQFVVCDNKGNILKDLTDLKRYQFILKKAFQIFRKINQKLEKGNSLDISNIPELKKNLRILKSFFGPLFVPENLLLPYTSGDNPKLILTDYKGMRSYFWYKTTSNFGLICFFDKNLVSQKSGLKKIISALNKSNSTYITGIVSHTDITKPLTAFKESLVPDMILAMANFSNSSKPFTETARTYIAIRLLGTDLRAFSVMPKKQLEENRDELRYTILVKTFIIYLIIILVGIFYIRVKAEFISIRWKLVVIFLYSTLIPIVILTGITYNYLQNKRVSLRNQAQNRGLKLIQDFDSRFQIELAGLTQHLNNFAQKLSQESGYKPFSAAMIAKLEQETRKLAPSESHLVNRFGKAVFSFSTKKGHKKHSSGFMILIGKKILRFLNNEPEPKTSSKAYKALISPDTSHFVRSAQRESRKVHAYTLGNDSKFGYWYIFGSKNKNRNDYFLSDHMG